MEVGGEDGGAVAFILTADVVVVVVLAVVGGTEG